MCCLVGVLTCVLVSIATHKNLLVETNNTKCQLSNWKELFILHHFPLPISCLKSNSGYFHVVVPYTFWGNLLLYFRLLQKFFLRVWDSNTDTDAGIKYKKGVNWPYIREYSEHVNNGIEHDRMVFSNVWMVLMVTFLTISGRLGWFGTVILVTCFCTLSGGCKKFRRKCSWLG